MAKRPNILLVIADQWRAQSCGWAGCRDVQTPHLDRFATQAVDVCQAVSGVPVCTPARANLLTALRPDRHGLFINDVPLDPGLPSLGKHFSAAGYDTAYIGKWHVDGHGRHGFIPPGRRHGFATWKVCECTHDYLDSRYHEDSPEESQWAGYDAFAQTDAMCAWLRGRGHAKPFLGVLAWGPPHNPYHSAPAGYLARYEAARLTLPPTIRPEDVAEARKNLAGYYAHISALDDCFARLESTVQELGLAEDTIIVFTSDHGDFIGCHGLYDKQGPWDEAIRIPFLIRGPGLAAGTRNRQMLDLVDLWPTLAGLAGLEAPTGVQGRDRSAHLRAGTMPEDDAALYASYQVFGNWPQIARRHGAGPLFQAREARGLRTPTHTYVEDRNGPWLLYDNDADPWQQRNLAGDPLHAATQGRLAVRLRRMLAEEQDAFLGGAELIRRFDWQVDAGGTASTAD